jgi:acyl-CoA thioesterase
MDVTLRRVFFEKVKEEGYAEKMGLQLIDLEAGHAVVQMTPTSQDVNIHGIVHGGAIFSLIDEAFQISCNSHGTVALALSVSVTYHRAAEKGEKLRAESKEIHRSAKTASYDIKVTNEKGMLIASCQALAYRKREPLPFLEGKE